MKLLKEVEGELYFQGGWVLVDSAGVAVRLDELFDDVEIQLDKKVRVTIEVEEQSSQKA